MAENEQSKVDLFSPQEIAARVAEAGERKTHLNLMRLGLLSVLAGAYIAFGAVFSAVSITGMSGIWPYGFMKVIAGLTFSLGLILVVLSGAELFTGNSLMIISWMHRKITLGQLLANWIIVYLGNFIGSLFIAVLVLLGKLYTFSSGDLGKTMLIVANTKVQYNFIQALVLGMLCNILVCLAVWMASSSRTAGGKILAIIFPIAAFIAAGFEHSVANMYIIPAALLTKASDPTFVASLGLDLSALTWSGFLLGNLLPVTLGNILGGAGFVGLFYALIYPTAGKKNG
jgi:formate/nitrite transporter